MIKLIARLSVCAAMFMTLIGVTAAADRPNILWITAEDMSPTLGCYGDSYAITPNLDRFASRGVRYTNGFATAPVCSPSRSCLINGVYAQSQGTHNMRSAFAIPNSMEGFPTLLRKAGYYTSNNVKTDYNSGNWDKIIKASWNESSGDAHWRSKRSGQPFFSVFNLMTSHQSRTMVWPYDKFKSEVQSKLPKNHIHDPAKASLPPYYPDTPVIRKTVARYYDCVTLMDRQVGEILSQLEADGLADDTIVFFYSDHGSGMPRHKRALLDSGMKVALMIRFPDKYKHLAPSGPGTTSDRLVSFVDFGPTVLSLLGMDLPKHMQGEPFLGKHTSDPRRYVFGHRDRVDEVIDMARSVRDKRYLYIRNYMPHLGYNQPTAWPDLGEIRHEFYRLAGSDALTPTQRHFVSSTRPVEELYDCEQDPWNMTNLIDSPKHAKVLQRLRSTLAKQLVRSRDLGFLPEPLAWERARDTTLWNVARTKGSYDQRRLIDAASLVGTGSEEQLINLAKSDDAGVRYWAATGLHAHRELSLKAKSVLQSMFADSSVTVRIAAADAAIHHGDTSDAIGILSDALNDKNLANVLHAARTIELLGTKAKAARDAMAATDKRMKGLRPKDMPATVVQPGNLDMAMFIGFSTKAFLDRVR